MMHRTGIASRTSGLADRLAEFHQRRVQRAWIISALHKFLGAVPESFDARGGIHGSGVIVETRQHARDVTVDDGFGQTKSETADGAGGVGTDAGKAADDFRITWKHAAVIADDDLGELVQIPRAAVIA